MEGGESFDGEYFFVLNSNITKGRLTCSKIILHMITVTGN